MFWGLYYIFILFHVSFKIWKQDGKTWLFLLFLASQDALEVIVSLSQWVSEWVTLRTELTDVTLVSEDTYWRLYWELLIINDTYGGDVREIVVLIMEVDKVVDEVTDMEIDK